MPHLSHTLSLNGNAVVAVGMADVGEGAAGVLKRAVVVAAITTLVTDVGDGAARVLKRAVVVASVLPVDTWTGRRVVLPSDDVVLVVETLALTDVGDGAAGVLKRAVVVAAVLPVDMAYRWLRTRSGRYWRTRRNVIIRVLRTYLCRPGCRRTTCDQILSCRELHNS